MVVSENVVMSKPWPNNPSVNHPEVIQYDVFSSSIFADAIFQVPSENLNFLDLEA